MAGNALSKWISGSGDYLTNFEGTKSNSLMASGPPVFEGNKHSIRIRKREYLGIVKNGAVVSGSTAFKNDVYPINPGLAHTFPWLSNVAR